MSLAGRVAVRFVLGLEETEPEETNVQRKGPPAKWSDFLDQKYQGGKKQVPNPNPESRISHPMVTFNTAMKDKTFRDHAMKEYYEWLAKDESKEGPSEKARKFIDELPQKVAPKHPSGITSDHISEVLKKHKAAFTEIVKEATEEIAKYKKDIPEKTQAEWFTKHFDELSKEEKLLHVAGHKFGEYFEKVISKDKELQADHQQYTRYWQQDSGNAMSQELHGYLESLGYSGSMTEADIEKDMGRYRERAKKSLEVKRYFDTVYTYTQAVMKHLGIEEVTLFRGVKGKNIEAEPPELGDDVRIETRQLASYTTDPKVASDFGRVLKFKVPAERVFLSSISCPTMDSDAKEKAKFGEAEITVMGGSDIEGKIITGATDEPVRRFRVSAIKRPFKIEISDDNENWLRKRRLKNKASARCVILRFMGAM